MKLIPLAVFIREHIVLWTDIINVWRQNRMQMRD